MPTIAQQLTQLESDRQDLVSNLQTKGITGLTGDETFTELVPEVLNIGGGDLDGLLDGSITSLESDVLSVKSYACYGSTSLETVSLPNATIIGISAFNFCTSLTSFTAPSLETLGASSLRGCTSLQSINLPSVTAFSGTSVFEGCSNVTSITLGTIAGNIPQYTFRDCIELDTLNWTLGGTNYIVNNGAFYNCVQLQHLAFTNASVIGESCFRGCTNLLDVDCGNTSQIQMFTFYGCTSLEKITLRKTGSICTLANTNAIPTGQNITIYVPSDLISTYQSASNWTTLYNNGDVTFVAIS